MKKLRILYALIIIGSLFVSALPIHQVYAVGSTYYVAKTGNDTTGDGSSGNPWLTIGKAVAVMVGGDTTYVHAGTYNEILDVITKDGSAGNYINLKGYTGERPIIDGTGIVPSTGISGVINSYNASYWWIENFEIVNGTGHAAETGIYWYGTADYVTFKNLKIHYTNDSGIAVAFGTHITIDGCEVYNTNISGFNEGISFYGVNGFEIKNNTVHDTLGTPGYLNIKEGIDIKNGSTGGIIHHNEVYNTWAGIKNDSYSDGLSNLSYYDNYIHNNENGLVSISEHGEDITDVSFYNNLVINNGSDSGGYSVQIGWNDAGNSISAVTAFTRVYFINNTITTTNNDRVFFIWMESYNTISGVVYSDCRFVNNILDTHLDTSSHRSIATSGGQVVPAGLLVDYNLFYTNAYEGGPYGTHSTLGNPVFVNPASDFHLQASSAARDTGTSVNAPVTDYDGNARPQGSAVDIGAYEFAGPPTPTGVSATDGTFTDKVRITWIKATGATGYKVYRAGSLIDTLGDVATYDDTTAQVPVINPGTANASDGTNQTQTILSLSGQSVTDTTYTYTVVAVNVDGDSTQSAGDTGFIGHGTLTLQWQRSAGNSDAAYSDLAGATTNPFNDTTAPIDGSGRYYKVVEDATGATQQTSTADRGFRSTGSDAPTVQTLIVTGITVSGGSSGGNITSTGSANVTERGIVYGATAYPTTSDSKYTDTVGSPFSTGIYIKTLSNLTNTTTYHVRAYAINSLGTSYGDDVFFTTSTPVVTPPQNPTQLDVQSMSKAFLPLIFIILAIVYMIRTIGNEPNPVGIVIAVMIIIVAIGLLGGMYTALP